MTGQRNDAVALGDEHDDSGRPPESYDDVDGPEEVVVLRTFERRAESGRSEIEDELDAGEGEHEASVAASVLGTSNSDTSAFAHTAIARAMTPATTT